MKNTDEKIDELARMVADGFAKSATKDDLERMATKDDLAALERKMATKDDLAALREEIDFMLNRTIGVFRKDFDELAKRVKKLEEAIFSPLDPAGIRRR